MALSDHDRMLLGTKMSPGSLGMIMGRSEAWVNRMRAAIAAQTARTSAPERALERKGEQPAAAASGRAVAPPLVGAPLTPVRAGQAYEDWAEENRAPAPPSVDAASAVDIDQSPRAPSPEPRAQGVRRA